MARVNVVFTRSDGGLEVHPMNEWLRQHPEHVPAGLHPTNSTSHQLRDGLRKKGWVVQTSPDEVRLLPPGGQGVEDAVAAVLGPEDDSAGEESAAEEAAFRFEVQLRDFIAQNLAAIAFIVKSFGCSLMTTGGVGLSIQPQSAPLTFWPPIPGALSTCSS